MLAHNIYKLSVIKFAKWFMLYMPIIGLFYADNNLSAFQLFIIQAGYSFSSAVFEIPSGYFADVVGRRKTLIIGSCMGTLGFTIYALSGSFVAFLCAEIIMGIGQSFISGTDSAMLYDSVQHIQQKDAYLKYEGRITSLGGFAETGAALLGGIIAGVTSLHSVFVVQACIAGLAIPAALLLQEPPRTKLIHTGISQVFRISYQSLFVNKKLRTSILFSSGIGMATLAMAWTLQTYFVYHNFTETQTTTLWVLYNGLVAAISLFAAYIISKIGEKPLLTSICVIVPLGFISLGYTPVAFALSFLVLFHIVRGYATPILKDMIQNDCEPEIRATILSLRGMIIRLGFAIVGPVIGFMSGKFSFEFAVTVAGILFLVTAGTLLTMYWASHVYTNKNNW
ncbi:MAG TPA: MFS transporter [Bacteroidales bacterium]|nr:MFS transporter [Bacteroidales bacterium]HRS17883.1 MFS transporter [Bacteroidales bacterium]